MKSLVVALALASAAFLAPSANAADLILRPQGSETVQFNYLAQKCENIDHPDAPPRAFRDNQGVVHMIAAHFRARFDTGYSLLALTHNCNVVYDSERELVLKDHSNLSWMISPYILSNGKVISLVHNEFHGVKVPGMCADGRGWSCWYNSIPQTISHDGGRTWEQPGDEPAPLAFGLPYAYPAGGAGTRIGVFNPSNIFKGPDGALYAFAMVPAYQLQERGNCLFRTTDPENPAAWRGWDGTGFNVRQVDIYQEPDVNPADHICKPVAPEVLGSDIGSVQKHSPSGLYLAVWGEQVWHWDASKPVGQQSWRTGHVYSSTSSDLITWAPKRVVMDKSQWGTECPAAPGVAVNWTTYGYPGLLPVTSSSANYDVIDHNGAMIYHTAFRRRTCDITTARDLVYQWVSIEVVP